MLTKCFVKYCHLTGKRCNIKETNALWQNQPRVTRFHIQRLLLLFKNWSMWGTPTSEAPEPRCAIQPLSQNASELMDRKLYGLFGRALESDCVSLWWSELIVFSTSKYLYATAIQVLVSFSLLVNCWYLLCSNKFCKRLIHRKQAGFRSGWGYVNHIFTFHQ